MIRGGTGAVGAVWRGGVGFERLLEVERLDFRT